MGKEVTDAEIKEIEALGEGVYLQKAVARGLIKRLCRVEKEQAQDLRDYLRDLKQLRAQLAAAEAQISTRGVILFRLAIWAAWGFAGGVMFARWLLS